jgi:hypothetical protein
MKGDSFRLIQRENLGLSKYRNFSHSLLLLPKSIFKLKRTKRISIHEPNPA